MRTFCAALIALATGLPLSALAQKLSADSVFRGGKILTVDAKFSTAEAVAIKDGRLA